LHFLKGKYPSYNIILSDLGGKIEYMEFLSDKTEIEYEEIRQDGKEHIKLHIPVINPDPFDTVIHIVLK
jgi:hypothetical protein